MPKVEVLDVTKLVEREGFKCPECKHRHSGKTLAYICVGCPCDFVPDFGAIAAKQAKEGEPPRSLDANEQWIRNITPDPPESK